MKSASLTLQRFATAIGIISIALLVPMPSPAAGAPLPPTSVSPAVIAARELTDPLRSGWDVSLPTDFEQVMGYRPAVIESDGELRLVKPAGNCSSPFGPTVYDFAVACAQHDLGYDLLRYATAVHTPLGTWARRAIDQQFASTARAHCAVTTAGANRVDCEAVADLYAGVVRLNSLRQLNGNPGREPVTRLVLLGAGVLAVAGLSVATRRSR